ncbi:hypothetical protein MKX03_021807 [Papaver bracteatum]|nr:hypothetical protein MKX03_021807 [Papaver bracteatum]
MVLGELSGSISLDVQKMNNVTLIEEKALNDCLNEITRALLKADVHFDLVKNLKINIKKIVNLDDLAAGHNKRRIIQQILFLMVFSITFFFPDNGGSGKPTSCTKYAHYHQKKGFKPALVCADTFRAGAFDQLKQNATRAKIPFYGSYVESDPVKIAIEGVERFKKENCDPIIIDIQQEASLFEEMRQLAESTAIFIYCYFLLLFYFVQLSFLIIQKPDLVSFVMDSSIGQAQAFNQSVSVGAVIVTKTEGAAKGGGALSAVAATKSPVIFLGDWHMYEFEVFDVKPFVSRLLGGMGGLQNLTKQMGSSKDMMGMLGNMGGMDQ